ncbi:hypothetical protein PVAG01_05837 [Phlyctema vagabunda]|uniref:Alcohol acetyltransferase n=1 Tax=Phlyctema vagabunda TaxID=108571 RepID=A0ABR4PEC6_9HELO
MGEPPYSSRDLLNLGPLGRFYAARNELGFYRCTAVLGVYSFRTHDVPDPDAWFKEHFYHALFRTVLSHPVLCYGILNQTLEREAVFLRLQEIYRDDVAEFEDEEDVKGDGNVDVAIKKLLERSHKRILQDGQRIPAWRVVCFKHDGRWHTPKPRQEQQRISILFLASHAIADGLSSVLFHKSLLRYFNDSTITGASWPLVVPRDTPGPNLLEDAVDLQQIDRNTIPTIAYGAPSTWAGANMFLSSIDDYQTVVRLVTIPVQKKGAVAELCRQRKITVTGLIHALVVAFLSRNTPKGSSYLVVTPYSMRQITHARADEMCNHAGGLVHEFAADIVASVRACAVDSKEELDKIVEIAQIYRKDLKEELARCPKNNAWAVMFGVKDWYAPSLAQLGKKRALTYEHSNLGNIIIEENGENVIGRKLELEKLVASQCGSVTGPVFGCNAISLVDGPLTVTVTWQKGAMDEDMGYKLVEYLTNRLMNGITCTV